MVKKILLVFILLNWLSYTSAQFFDSNHLYFSGGVNLGNYFGAEQKLNYIYKSKWAFKAGQTLNFRFAKSQPEDYTPGLFGGILVAQLPFEVDKFDSYYASAGRIIQLNKSKTLRANITLGGGYTIIEEPYNWKPIEDAHFLGPNYTFDNEKHHKFSFILDPDVEFAFTRYFGLTLSPILEVNQDRVHVGIGIGMMVGLLRNKLK